MKLVRVLPRERSRVIVIPAAKLLAKIAEKSERKEERVRGGGGCGQETLNGDRKGQLSSWHSST